MVLAPDTTITWVNDAAGYLLGRSPEEAIGRSIAEFVHPDDLPRAAEVMALVADGRFENDPVTPAQYRIMTGAGVWKPIEINGSSVPGPAGGEMLITGRYAGDLFHLDELLEAITGGEPLSRQVELILSMGRWRYPREGYAIIAHRTVGGPRDRRPERFVQTCDGLPPMLAGVGADDLAAPWKAALERGEDVAVADLADPGLDHDVIAPELARIALDAGYAGCLAVPVPDPGQESGACILVWSTHIGPSLAGHRYAVGNMRRALGLVLQQRAQVEQLERGAHVDELTGLASRGRFLELLRDDHGVLTGSDRHAVIYVDLDRFKAVNDAHGHTVGDQVLAECAARIHESVSAEATAGRLGGDEFAVLFSGGWTEGDVESAAERIVARLADPMDIAGSTSTVGASVGVAFGEPGDAGVDVLDAADRALAVAKREGRSRWRRATDPQPT